MFIIEKIKEDWLLSLKVLIGVLVILLFVFYFRSMLIILVTIVSLLAIFGVLAFAVSSLLKSYQTGFMGFFILMACMIYNPNLEKFNLFIQNEVSKKIIISNSQMHSDWVIFSIYTIECSSNESYMDDNNQTQTKKISLPTQYYIGILKNFWNITRESGRTIDKKVASEDTYVHRIADIVDSELSRVELSMQNAKLDAMTQQDFVKGKPLINLFGE